MRESILVVAVLGISLLCLGFIVFSKRLERRQQAKPRPSAPSARTFPPQPTTDAPASQQATADPVAQATPQASAAISWGAEGSLPGQWHFGGGAGAKSDVATSVPTEPADSPQPASMSGFALNEPIYAALIHLSALICVTGLPLMQLILPGLLWVLKRDQSPTLDQHGRAAINFQLSMMLLQLGCAAVGACLVMLMPEFFRSLLASTRLLRAAFDSVLHLPVNLFTAVPFCYGLICSIHAGLAASQNQAYRYPVCLPFTEKSFWALPFGPGAKTAAEASPKQLADHTA